MWKIAVFAYLCLCAGVASARWLLAVGENVNTEECLDPSDCDGCQYILVDDECYKMANESHNECEIQEQCAGIKGSLCIENVCRGQKELGESCETNAECMTVNQLVCVSGTCACPSGNVQFEETCLVLAGALGDSCEKDVQCEAVTGICSDGTCRAKEDSATLCDDENAEKGDDGCSCRDGFVESEDKKSCLKVAEKIGDECAIALQCESVSGTCIEGICKESDAVSDGNPVAATATIVLGASCEKDEDCSSVDNAVCKESICQCNETHFMNDEGYKCLSFAEKAGDECEISKQCSKLSNHSSCIDGKCLAVATASINLGKSGTSSPFATSARIAATAMIALSAIFA